MNWFKKIAGLCLALAAPGMATQAEAKILLRVGDNLPATHFLSKDGIKYFMDNVTKRTNGEVTFQYFPAQQIGKASDMLQLVQSGVLDIGLVLSAYVSEKMPLTGVMDLPGTYDSSCQGTKIYSELTKPGAWLAESDFKPNNIRMIFGFINPPYQLFVSKKNISSVDSIRGMKVRSPGGPIDNMLVGMGAVPIQMTSPEVYESLSRGTIDGMVFPAPTVLSYKMEGLVGSATKGANFGNTAIAYSMSAKKWDALPENVRKVIEEVGAETSAHVCGVADAQIDSVYAGFDKRGVTPIVVSDEERKKLDSVFENVRNDWAKAVTAQGRDGQRTLTAFEEARRKHAGN